MRTLEVQRSERNYGGIFGREKVEWNVIWRIDQCEQSEFDCGVDQIWERTGKRDLEQRTSEIVEDSLGN
jgi:hypothetical protein